MLKSKTLIQDMFTEKHEYNVIKILKTQSIIIIIRFFIVLKSKTLIMYLSSLQIIITPSPVIGFNQDCPHTMYAHSPLPGGVFQPCMQSRSSPYL